MSGIPFIRHYNSNPLEGPCQQPIMEFKDISRDEKRYREYILSIDRDRAIRRMTDYFKTLNAGAAASSSNANSLSGAKPYARTFL